MCRKLLKVRRDTDSRRTASFVGAITMLIVSVALTSLLFYLNNEFADAVNKSVTGSLIAIVFFPVGLILIAITGGTVISGVITSIKACFSTVKSIKITSIILTILSLAAAGYYIFILYNFLAMIGG